MPTVLVPVRLAKLPARAILLTMAQRASFILGGLALGCAGCAACSASDGPVVLEQPSTTSGGSGGQGGHGGATGGGGLGIGGQYCGPPCSADLKRVLDCDGTTVEDCGVDRACANGVCTDDPCGAADAAQTSVGCEFWAVKPDPALSGYCFAAFVANNWDAPAHIEVSRDGIVYDEPSFIGIPTGQGAAIAYAPYDASTGLGVGEVAILFLSRDAIAGPPPCPLAPAIEAEVGVRGTGYGHGFRIAADRPVAVYSSVPFGANEVPNGSASLLLPTSTWDTNYIAVSAYRPFQMPQLQGFPSIIMLAKEDATEVTLLPKVAVLGGNGIGPAPANVPVVYSLNEGEYLQLAQGAELTGSALQSNKPIGLWGSQDSMNVPPDYGGSDNAHQQIPPVKALGSRYVGVRYRNRMAAATEEVPPWRLVGAVDGTELEWTPSVPPGAPTTLDRGELAEFFTAGPFVVASQDTEHPFHMGQYMTGAWYIASPVPFMGEGDPEWVGVIPADQYLEHYIFFTDPTFPEASLVVVRSPAAASGLFEDVSLDCLGPLTGWQPVGQFQYTRVDLATGDFEPVGTCNNGRHEMSSSAPFGVTVWGWGGYSQSTIRTHASYAYPAGGRLRAINDVVVPSTPR
jgi:hypothetical protein